MTTPSTDADRLRWWQWIGPWPLRPFAVGLLAGLFALATTSYSLTVASAPRTVGSAAAVGLASGVTMWMFRRFAAGTVARMPGYVLSVAGVSLAAVSVRTATGTILDFPNFDPAANFAFTWLRATIFAFIMLALLGASQRRLQQQVDRADAALAVTQAQAEALLTADEEVRHQVSLLLHDRVQAGLIAACLQLRRTLGGDEVRDGQVTQVVDDLERLRALDVRRAVHALSPNLREVDLLTALEELADTYRPAMTIDIAATAESAIPESLRLGIYRIVEQALLNAAVHGSAAHCSVRIDQQGDDLQLVISDDGDGLAAKARPGFGSTLIDTWCRVLGGTWSRSAASPGTRVSVSLPAS
jgi:glucose-6-phosphate-specific signal transduction histidine kinase